MEFIRRGIAIVLCCVLIAGNALATEPDAGQYTSEGELIFEVVPIIDETEEEAGAPEIVETVEIIDETEPAEETVAEMIAEPVIEIATEPIVGIAAEPAEEAVVETTAEISTEPVTEASIKAEYIETPLNAMGELLLKEIWMTSEEPSMTVGKSTRFTVGIEGRSSTFKVTVRAFVGNGSAVAYEGEQTGTFSFDFTPDAKGEYKFSVTVKDLISGQSLYIQTCAFCWGATEEQLSDDSSVPGIVQSIVRDYTDNEMTDTEKAKALHDYLIYHAYYLNSGDNPHSAAGVLLDGYGVCESYADAYAMLLTAVGIENTVVNSVVSNHAWNKALLDGKWVNVDATFDDPVVNGEPLRAVSGYERDDYFAVTDEELQKLDNDRDWNTINGTHVAGVSTIGNDVGALVPDSGAPRKYNSLSGTQEYTRDTDLNQSRTLQLDIKAKYSAKLTYTSNDPKIKIDGNGKVTIPAGYVGAAVLTVTAEETEEYASVSMPVSLTVNKLENRITFEGPGKADASEKQQTVRLKASARENAKLNWVWKRSVQKNWTGDMGEISISEDGILTVPAGYVGTFTAMILCEETEHYLAASATAEIQIVQIENKITCGGVTLRSSASERTVSLNAKCESGDALGYRSSSDRIWVDWEGMASIPAGYYGESEVTLTAPENGIYRETTLTVPIVVTDAVQDFVERSYSLILGRKADPDGLKAWTDGLKDGTFTGGSIVWGFINSDEFRLSGKTNAEKVEILYQVMLDRGSDPAGREAWIGCLDDGMSENAIAAGFVGSIEFGTVCEDYQISPGTVTVTEARDKNQQVTSFVSRCYREALERGADASGLNGWCEIILTKAATPQTVAQGFVFSPEVTLKKMGDNLFVDMLYRLYMGRAADPAGRAAWVSVLEQGASREQVSEGFARSTEFTAIVAGYGL